MVGDHIVECCFACAAVSAHNGNISLYVEFEYGASFAGDLDMIGTLHNQHLQTVCGFSDKVVHIFYDRTAVQHLNLEFVFAEIHHVVHIHYDFAILCNS